MDILEKALEKSEQVEQVEQASEAEPVEVGLEQALDKFEQVDDIREAEEKVANAEFKPDRKQSGASEKRLVNIDWHKLAKEGYLSQELDLPVLVDEYRTIKRPILYNAFGRGAEGIERANLILVTSSLPGEGKTFNAVNLALSIANEIHALENEPTLLMTGGTWDANSEAFQGQVAEQVLRSYDFDQLFIGADGIDIERGTTTFNELIGLSRVMAEVAREVIVMVESDKIAKKIPINKYDKLTLFSDNIKANKIY